MKWFILGLILLGMAAHACPDKGSTTKVDQWGTARTKTSDGKTITCKTDQYGVERCK